jgi:hypothetical protein
VAPGLVVNLRGIHPEHSHPDVKSTRNRPNEALGFRRQNNTALLRRIASPQTNLSIEFSPTVLVWTPLE